MLDPHPGDELAADVADPTSEVSVLALGSVILRRRRLVMALGLLGAAAGLASGLLSTRVYKASATFIPQGTETGMSGLALTAGQFGIRIPSSSNSWGAPIYVELARSRALLEPIVLDTVRVAEEHGAAITVMDLLKVEAPTQALRTELAVRALRDIVTAEEDKKQGAVNLSVKTRWPSVSLWVAERLVQGVNLFNVATRKSQARAERLFVEAQTVEAETALRAAEDRLQSFLQQNRVTSNSSQLEFERDRLQRAVQLRQSVYTTLEQNREEARIREVRDIPVITVLEEPQLPVLPEPSRALLKAIAGGAVGVIIGIWIAFLSNSMRLLRRDRSAAAIEFFRLAFDALPAFVRRRFQSRPMERS